jgi:hypothetical protein
MDFGIFTMVPTRVQEGFCVFVQKLREDESQKREQNPNLALLMP